MSRRFVCVLVLSLFAMSSRTYRARAAETIEPAGRWSEQRHNDWYAEKPWLVGCNFGPSNAINELEMWQADTFDPVTLDRELGWAEGLGFNSVRVFLHDLPYHDDAEGFLKRIDQFLAIADRHHIGATLVIFDACWDPYPKSGKQHAPQPFVHNSGWVQSPGKAILSAPAKQDALKPYVQGVIGRFKSDPRVHAWDLFNEPDNTNRNSYGSEEPANKAQLSLTLLRKTFAWAREVNPSQPLTTGVWIGNWADPSKLSPMEREQLDNSDVISFHSYAPLPEMKRCVENLRRYNRPLFCTEYMARPQGSTFETIMPYLKAQKVAAYNWGFVQGKTQTIFPWDSWQKHYTAEPPLWFHDIFRTDGTPYDPKEVALIRQTTGKAGQ